MKRFLITLLAFIFAGLPYAEAVSRCPRCSYLVNSDTYECPKCLKLLRWPFTPERSRRGKLVVRTGSDAFIRHPHAKTRAFADDRNAGGDLSGEIGCWGGPNTLRYLLRFDIEQNAGLAGINLAEFTVRRAFLKISSIQNGQGIDMPVVVYPLSRPFLEGNDRSGLRKKNHDGCDWYYSAPLLTWHSEGGDFDASVSCEGIIKGNGSASFIDITRIIKLRLEAFSKTGTWYDPGLLIMSAPQQSVESGFVTIYSLESNFHGQIVRSPELFIE